MVPLQDVQRHVELWFVGCRRSDQLALGVSRDDVAVCQRESVQRAERVAVPQHCEETGIENYLPLRTEPKNCKVWLSRNRLQGELRLVLLTVLLVFLGEGHLPVVLQVKPLNAPPDQVLPARLHGRTEQTGVQGRDLTFKR